MTLSSIIESFIFNKDRRIINEIILYYRKTNVKFSGFINNNKKMLMNY